MTSYSDKVDVLEQKVFDAIKSTLTLLDNKAFKSSHNAEAVAKFGLHAQTKFEQATKSTDVLEGIMEHKQSRADKLEASDEASSEVNKR